MTTENYHRCLKLIQSSGKADFEGPKPEALIAKAESVLGIKFPPSYRLFLLELGCGNIGSFEVYGLINEDFENSAVPDEVWATLNERRFLGADTKFIIIGSAGDGSHYALNINNNGSSGEAEVVHLSINGKEFDKVADSFEEYFLRGVNKVL